MKLLILFLAASQLWVTVARAAEYSPEQYYREGEKLDRSQQYFLAARYYFQGVQKAELLSQKAMGHARIANSLAALGLFQSASYFYLQALGSGEDQAIRVALHATPVLLDNVGAAIFKKYMIRYTKAEQYNSDARDHYLYILAQDHLFNQRPEQALSVSSSVGSRFADYPSLLFLRGTAALLRGQPSAAVESFRECSNVAENKRYNQFNSENEAKELRNRCVAGVARAYYQAKNYAEADKWYDLVSIDSFVWPQIQYERAWSSIARGDYNRALGRLMTYRSPGLSWFRDSEADMLRTLSYLQLCIYEDVDKESNFFGNRHTVAGEKIKALLERTASGSTSSLVELFKLGVKAAGQKVQSDDVVVQILNRFVRSPQFVSLMNTGQKVRTELNFLDNQGDAGRRGIGSFLRDTLVWRWETAQELGGNFVRDRLTTEYKVLVNNIQTVDIVKLEMLRRERKRIEGSDLNAGTDVWGEKKKGSLGKPKIRDDQFFWEFNSEFWADELGDYVFALRPECAK